MPVRLITDQAQYRNPTYFWHAYNVDRMFVAGIPSSGRSSRPIRTSIRNRWSFTDAGLAVFGSSNWTASSSDTQREHNYFTRKTWFVDWFAAQFLRKWNNLRIDGTRDQPDDVPDRSRRAGQSHPSTLTSKRRVDLGSRCTLRWEGGWWAHKYDVHFGTTNPPPLVAQDYMPGVGDRGRLVRKRNRSIPAHRRRHSSRSVRQG